MKAFTVALLFIIAFGIKAQDIEKEILEYTDSEQIIISKSRKLLYDKIADKDTVKIKEVLSYIDKKFDPEKYLVLWENERWLLDYLVSDYQDIIKRVILYQESFNENKIYPSKDLLWERLIELSRTNYVDLNSGIKISKCGEEEKDFLSLLLKALLIDDEGEFASQKELNKNADDFLSYYTNSDFIPFIRNNIRYVYKPSPWGFAFDFFSGYGQFNGTLNDHFEPNVPFGLSIDIQYKSLISYFRLYMGFTKVIKEFTYNGSWKKDLPISVFIPEISFGIPVIETNFIKAVPFMGLTWIDIAPPEEDAKIPGNDVDLGFSAGFTYGLNLDFKIINGSSGYFSEYETGYWYLRFRVGYTHPSFSEKYSSFTGNMFFLNIGIGGFGRTIVRDL